MTNWSGNPLPPRSPWYQASTRTIGRPIKRERGESLDLTRPVVGAAQVLEALQGIPRPRVHDAPTAPLRDWSVWPRCSPLPRLASVTGGLPCLATECSWNTRRRSLDSPVPGRSSHGFKDRLLP